MDDLLREVGLFIERQSMRIGQDIIDELRSAGPSRETIDLDRSRSVRHDSGAGPFGVRRNLHQDIDFQFSDKLRRLSVALGVDVMELMKGLGDPRTQLAAVAWCNRQPDRL